LYIGGFSNHYNKENSKLFPRPQNYPKNFEREKWVEIVVEKYNLKEFGPIVGLILMEIQINQ
jgi:hypothetical protein